MSIWGKVIGGTAGFFMGGPLGALIGAAAGHAYDRYKDGAQPDGEPRGPGFGDAFRAANRQAAFTIAVVALAAKMAKADGVVTKDEIATFKRLFHIPESEMANVGRLFDPSCGHALALRANRDASQS